jgi:hypothetical protein
VLEEIDRRDAASEAARAAAHAAEYVAARGDALARRRADVLVGRAVASEVVAQLAPAAAESESLREALEICDDLRALGDPRVRELAEQVALHQADDGGFAPARPLEVRLFETGMIAGHLAKTRWARPDLIERAGEFLAAHWHPDRVRGGSWCAIAAYAHFFSNAPHDDADAVLQWCGRELGRAFATRAFDAVRTARVLVYCDAHGLPGAPLRRAELVAALVAEQAPDGGFPAHAGERPRDRLAATLDALVALRRLG